jgi:hypothetical protein
MVSIVTECVMTMKTNNVRATESLWLESVQAASGADHWLMAL